MPNIKLTIVLFSDGTYKVSGKNMEELLDVALAAGYRSIGKPN